MRKTILVVDDEVSILNAIATILEDMGISVTTCTNAIRGEEKAIKEDYDLILIDIRMPEKNGAEVTRSVLKKRPDARILVITGYPNDPLTQQSLEAGAKGLIKKPFEIGKILDFLNSQ